MLIAIIVLRSLQEADRVGNANTIEVLRGGVTEGVAEDVSKFVARGLGVVDGFQGEAVESPIGIGDFSMGWYHLLGRKQRDRGTWVVNNAITNEDKRCRPETAKILRPMNLAFRTFPCTFHHSSPMFGINWAFRLHLSKSAARKYEERTDLTWST